jgi:hypothetical protein
MFENRQNNQQKFVWSPGSTFLLMTSFPVCGAAMALGDVISGQRHSLAVKIGRSTKSYNFKS